MKENICVRKIKFSVGHNAIITNIVKGHIKKKLSIQGVILVDKILFVDRNVNNSIYVNNFVNCNIMKIIMFIIVKKNNVRILV